MDAKITLRAVSFSRNGGDFVFGETHNPPVQNRPAAESFCVFFRPSCEITQMGIDRIAKSMAEFVAAEATKSACGFLQARRFFHHKFIGWHVVKHVTSKTRSQVTAIPIHT